MSRRVIRGFNQDALRHARHESGFAQTEVARLAKIGTETLRRWESGTASPQVDLLARVAEILGVAISDLVRVPETERYPGDWRVLRGMTQPQLGAKAGITTQTVSCVERGVISLSDSVAQKMSAALGISESELRAAHARARNRPPGAPA